MEEYDEALDHFYWIVAEFGDEEIWGDLKDRYPDRDSNPAALDRLHLDIYASRMQRGDNSRELFELAETYLIRFPNSKYANWMTVERYRLLQDLGEAP
jgi:hypothetical protein